MASSMGEPPSTTDWLHKSTMSQPASNAAKLAWAKLRVWPWIWRAAAMLRSSLKMAPVKPKRWRNTAWSQRAE